MPSTAEEQIAALSARFLPDVRASMEEAVSTANTLAPLLRYHLGWEDADGAPAHGGGKALRPVLCLAACEMAGGDWRRAVPIAAAVELVHNFSLAHDDIQDGDATRRGVRPCGPSGACPPPWLRGTRCRSSPAGPPSRSADGAWRPAWYAWPSPPSRPATSR